MNFSLLLVLQCDLLTHLEILCLLYLSLTLPTLVMDALTSCFSQECLVDTDGTLFSCRGSHWILCVWGFILAYPYLDKLIPRDLRELLL
jgi:hypothetical protein